jgi:hypothetical protein
MNMVQIEEDPDAYVPNIEIQHRRKEEMRKMEKWIEEQYAKKLYEHEKALFDFDESVDNLSQVSERYGGDPNNFAVHQGEELQSTVQQGVAKDAQQTQNDERPTN